MFQKEQIESDIQMKSTEIQQEAQCENKNLKPFCIKTGILWVMEHLENHGNFIFASSILPGLESHGKGLNLHSHGKSWNFQIYENKVIAQYFLI